MRESEPRATLSLVVPCFDEAEVFPVLRHELAALADGLAGRFETEILLVDDGSRDATWRLIREFANADPRVRGISFSRNFGQEAALTCGYDLARGDAVVCLDADLQDPPEAVRAMLELWQKGYDVVLGVREERVGETRFKRWTATLFYRALRGLGAGHVRAESGDFRLMSRRSLEALRRLREQHRFLRGLVGWVGFRTVELRYQRRPRAAGRTKYGLLRMLRLALDGIVSSSTAPLRLAFLLSFGLAFGSLAVAGASLLAGAGPHAPPGWTSLLLALTAFGGATLLCLGVLGEYVGRIYEQGQRRPLYLVQEDTLAHPVAGPED